MGPTPKGFKLNSQRHDKRRTLKGFKMNNRCPDKPGTPEGFKPNKGSTTNDEPRRGSR